MSEDRGGDKPQPTQSPATQVSRRSMIQKTGAVVVTIATGGALLENYMRTPEHKNAFQQQADRDLNDPSKPHIKFAVIDDPDFKALGNPGPAARNKPKVPEKGESSNDKGFLAVGKEVTGVYFAGGISPNNPRLQGLKREWITYRDEKGNIRFVAARYLEEVTPKQ